MAQQASGSLGSFFPGVEEKVATTTRGRWAKASTKRPKTPAKSKTSPTRMEQDFADEEEEKKEQGFADEQGEKKEQDFADEQGEKKGGEEGGRPLDQEGGEEGGQEGEEKGGEEGGQHPVEDEGEKEGGEKVNEEEEGGLGTEEDWLEDKGEKWGEGTEEDWSEDDEWCWKTGSWGWKTGSWGWKTGSWGWKTGSGHEEDEWWGQGSEEDWNEDDEWCWGWGEEDEWCWGEEDEWCWGWNEEEKKEDLADEEWEKKGGEEWSGRTTGKKRKARAAEEQGEGQQPKKRRKIQNPKKDEGDQAPMNRPKTLVELEPAPVVPVSTKVRCARCKGEVEATKAQLVGKCAGSWRCNTCNTRGTQLYRLPEWPGFSQKMRDFSEEQKAEFWASTHDANDKEQLKTLIEESLTTRQTESSEASTEGGYQPLSWYKKQGYDVKAIEEKCRDTRSHPIFGTTYRVKIDFVKSGNLSEKIHEKTMKKLEGGPSSSSEPMRMDDVSPPTDTKSLQKQKATAQKVLTKLGSVAAPLQLTLKNKASTTGNIKFDGTHDTYVT